MDGHFYLVSDFNECRVPLVLLWLVISFNKIDPNDTCSISPPYCREQHGFRSFSFLGLDRRFAQDLSAQDDLVTITLVEPLWAISSGRAWTRFIRWYGNRYSTWPWLATRGGRWSRDLLHSTWSLQISGSLWRRQRSYVSGSGCYELKVCAGEQFEHFVSLRILASLCCHSSPIIIVFIMASTTCSCSRHT